MDRHDALCPITTWRLGEEYRERCECHLIARVRADERARAYPGREVRSQLIGAYAQLSHAEAVAAKLVEVICEQDRAARDGQVLLSDAFKWQQMLTEERDAARADEGKRVHETLVALERERDAARAEVAALTDALDIAKDERYAARVEQARAAQRLRDLRAKVEGLRRTTEVMWDGEYVTLVQLSEVLALIEEAERG